MGLEISIAMADAAAVRRARRAAAAGPADGVLHRQPRGHLPVRVRQRRHPQHAAVAHLPVHDGLPAVRRAAVHLHGGDAGKGRHHRGAVRRHLQMAGLAEGRARIGDRRRLHGAGGDGRRRRRDRDHDGDDRAAGDAAAEVRPQARVRLAARRRHAGHPDPAVGDGDRLCGGRAAVAGRAADGIGVPGLPAVGPLRRLHHAALLHQSVARSRAADRGARQHAREASPAAQHDHAGAADPAGAGRDLPRHRDAGGSRGHRQLRRVRRLRAAPAAQLDRDPRSRRSRRSRPRRW